MATYLKWDCYASFFSVQKRVSRKDAERAKVSSIFSWRALRLCEIIFFESK